MTSSHEEHTNDQQLRHEDDMTTDERDRIAVVQWLKDNYTISTGGSVSKCEVYAHYLSMCRQKGVTFPMSRTFYGKLVRRAFPGIKSNRKGPRGQAKQHYTHLVRRTEDYVTGGEMTPGATGSPAGQRRSRSTSLPSSPALSPSSMNSSGCLSFTFQVRPQKPRQRSSSCKSSFTSSSSTATSASSSVQCSPVLSPLLYTSMPSSTTASPASSACSSPRQFLCSPVPSSPVPSPSTFLMPSPSPSTPQQSHYPSSQPSSPWPQNYDQSINREEGHTANTATSLSPYLDVWPMLEAPSILSTEAEALLYRCAMLKRVRERCRETQNGVERPTRDSFLFRAINDPSWNDAWADLGFAEWCLDNLL